MKKKIVIICSLICAVLMIPVVLISFAFGSKPQYDSSFYGGMAIKYNRLYGTKGRKIVVIGGSSVAFGLRSDILERETGIPVVNFGLYANLGTKYMLDVAEDAIGKDDIVIIAPEQNAQSLSTYFNGEAVWYSADGCFKILRKVSHDNYGDLMKSFLKFTSAKFGCWKKGQKPRPEGVYNADAFNAYGDIAYECPYNIMRDGYDAGTPISFDKNIISTAFIEYLNRYAERLRKQGAKIYYSFCPMNGSALRADTTEAQIRDYYEYLCDNLTIDMLGNPTKRIFDSGWFYDSNFHLNDSGAVYYTAQLAQDIKAELGDYSAVQVSVPSMPEKPEAGGIIGSLQSQDLQEAAKIFNLGGVRITALDGNVLYKGEWVIEGLTEYGATLEEIVLPDTLAGIPVTAIADDCFAGNTVLKKLTFGRNIASVGRGAFDGCVNLKEIYITSPDPTTFRPPETILDGLDGCAFYIPSDRYYAYSTDYFWQYLEIADKLKTY